MPGGAVPGGAVPGGAAPGGTAARRPGDAERSRSGDRLVDGPLRPLRERATRSRRGQRSLFLVLGKRDRRDHGRARDDGAAAFELLAGGLDRAQLLVLVVAQATVVGDLEVRAALGKLVSIVPSVSLARRFFGANRCARRHLATNVVLELGDRLLLLLGHELLADLRARLLVEGCVVGLVDRSRPRSRRSPPRSRSGRRPRLRRPRRWPRRAPARSGPGARRVAGRRARSWPSSVESSFVTSFHVSAWDRRRAGRPLPAPCPRRD